MIMKKQPLLYFKVEYKYNLQLKSSNENVTTRFYALVPVL